MLFRSMATWVASKPKVNSVTVLEISQDIIDAFLVNNKMPDNVSVIVTDANSFTTNKKYDCVIFDHISNGAPDSVLYKELCNSAKKIPHDLFWFWSLEFYYLRFYYGMDIRHFYQFEIDFSIFDFSRSWEKMRQVLNMSTIPSLPKNKIDDYVYSYFMRKK